MIVWCVFLRALLNAISYSFLRVNVLVAATLIVILYIVEYLYIWTHYILWLTVFPFIFVFFHGFFLFVILACIECRHSLKFSTPIAREIVKITSSLYRVLWNDACGLFYDLNGITFQATIHRQSTHNENGSFHFIDNRSPYKSLPDCLFSNGYVNHLWRK